MIKKLLVLLPFQSMCLFTFAQFTGQMGAYEALPQRHIANPALIPAGTFNIGIPVLNNIFLEHSNNWFLPLKHFENNVDQSVFQSDAFIASLDKHATTSLAFRLDLINFGIRVRKHYFAINVAERALARVAIPKDLLWLGVYGNSNSSYPLKDGTADLSDFSVDAIHYRQFSASWAYEWNEKWSFGIRLNYLYGMENINTARSSLSLRTDPVDFSLYSTGDFEVNTSGVGGGESDEDVHDDVMSYLLSLKNRGWSTDFGATYKLLEPLQLQISVNDLGVIRWKEDLANYATKDAGFAFRGFDLSRFILSNDSSFEEAFDDEIELLNDSIRDAYNFSETHETYTTGVFAYTRIAAEYKLYDNGKTSGKTWAAYHIGLGNRMIPSRVQAGYYQTVGKWLAADLHLSWQKEISPFLGAGIVLNGGAFQFFTLVENLHFLQLVKIHTEEDGSSFVYPANSGDIRVNLGFNLTFGRKKQVASAAPMI